MEAEAKKLESVDIQRLFQLLPHRYPFLMVDKITTVPKSRIGDPVGRLDDEDIVRLNQAMMVFLGLTVSPRMR